MFGFGSKKTKVSHKAFATLDSEGVPFEVSKNICLAQLALGVATGGEGGGSSSSSFPQQQSISTESGSGSGSSATASNKKDSWEYVNIADVHGLRTELSRGHELSSFYDLVVLYVPSLSVYRRHARDLAALSDDLPIVMVCEGSVMDEAAMMGALPLPRVSLVCSGSGGNGADSSPPSFADADAMVEGFVLLAVLAEVARVTRDASIAAAEQQLARKPSERLPPGAAPVGSSNAAMLAFAAICKTIAPLVPSATSVAYRPAPVKGSASYAAGKTPLLSGAVPFLPLFASRLPFRVGYDDSTGNPLWFAIASVPCWEDGRFVAPTADGHSPAAVVNSFLALSAQSEAAGGSATSTRARLVPQSATNTNNNNNGVQQQQQTSDYRVEMAVEAVFDDAEHLKAVLIATIAQTLLNGGGGGGGFAEGPAEAEAAAAAAVLSVVNMGNGIFHIKASTSVNSGNNNAAIGGSVPPAAVLRSLDELATRQLLPISFVSQCVTLQATGPLTSLCRHERLMRAGHTDPRSQLRIEEIALSAGGVGIGVGSNTSAAIDRWDRSPSRTGSTLGNSFVNGNGGYTSRSTSQGGAAFAPSAAVGIAAGLAVVPHHQQSQQSGLFGAGGSTAGLNHSAFGQSQHQHAMIPNGMGPRADSAASSALSSMPQTSHSPLRHHHTTSSAGHQSQDYNGLEAVAPLPPHLQQQQQYQQQLAYASAPGFGSADADGGGAPPPMSPSMPSPASQRNLSLMAAAAGPQHVQQQQQSPLQQQQQQPTYGNAISHGAISHGSNGSQQQRQQPQMAATSHAEAAVPVVQAPAAAIDPFASTFNPLAALNANAAGVQQLQQQPVPVAAAPQQPVLATSTPAPSQPPPPQYLTAAEVDLRIAAALQQQRAAFDAELAQQQSAMERRIAEAVGQGVATATAAANASLAAAEMRLMAKTAATAAAAAASAVSNHTPVSPGNAPSAFGPLTTSQPVSRSTSVNGGAAGGALVGSTDSVAGSPASTTAIKLLIEAECTALIAPLYDRLASDYHTKERFQEVANEIVEKIPKRDQVVGVIAAKVAASEATTKQHIAEAVGALRDEVAARLAGISSDTALTVQSSMAANNSQLMGNLNASVSAAISSAMLKQQSEAAAASARLREEARESHATLQSALQQCQQQLSSLSGQQSQLSVSYGVLSGTVATLSSTVTATATATAASRSASAAIIEGSSPLRSLGGGVAGAGGSNSNGSPFTSSPLSQQQQQTHHHSSPSPQCVTDARLSAAVGPLRTMVDQLTRDVSATTTALNATNQRLAEASAALGAKADVLKARADGIEGRVGYAEQSIAAATESSQRHSSELSALAANVNALHTTNAARRNFGASGTSTSSSLTAGAGASGTAIFSPSPHSPLRDGGDVADASGAVAVLQARLQSVEDQMGLLRSQQLSLQQHQHAPSSLLASPMPYGIGGGADGHPLHPNQQQQQRTHSVASSAAVTRTQSSRGLTTSVGTRQRAASSSAALYGSANSSVITTGADASVPATMADLRKYARRVDMDTRVDAMRTALNRITETFRAEVAARAEATEAKLKGYVDAVAAGSVAVNSGGSGLIPSVPLLAGGSPSRVAVGFGRAAHTYDAESGNAIAAAEALVERSAAELWARVEALVADSGAASRSLLRATVDQLQVYLEGEIREATAAARRGASASPPPPPSSVGVANSELVALVDHIASRVAELEGAVRESGGELRSVSRRLEAAESTPERMIMNRGSALFQQQQQQQQNALLSPRFEEVETLKAQCSANSAEIANVKGRVEGLEVARLALEPFLANEDAHVKTLRRMLERVQRLEQNAGLSSAPQSLAASRAPSPTTAFPPSASYNSGNNGGVSSGAGLWGEPRPPQQQQPSANANGTAFASSSSASLATRLSYGYDDSGSGRAPSPPYSSSGPSAARAAPLPPASSSGSGVAQQLAGAGVGGASVYVVGGGIVASSPVSSPSHTMAGSGGDVVKPRGLVFNPAGGTRQPSPVQPQ